MIDNLSIAAATPAMWMLILLSVDEIMLPRYINSSTNFWGCLLKAKRAYGLKQFIFFHILINISSLLQGIRQGHSLSALFPSSGRSSAQFASAWFRLFLALFNQKTYSFVRSIDIQCEWCNQIIKSYTGYVSLFTTPETMLKNRWSNWTNEPLLSCSW